MKTENVRLVTACMGSTDTPMLLNLTQDDIGEWAKDNDIDLLDKLKNKQKLESFTQFYSCLIYLRK